MSMLKRILEESDRERSLDSDCCGWVIDEIITYLNAMDDRSLAHMLDEARCTYVYEQAMKKDPLIAIPPK